VLYYVKRFWILDLRFWIDPVHKGTGLGDFRLSILDLFRPQGAGLEPKNNPKSKIQNLKLARSKICCPSPIYQA
jgi:hypothetical protein